MINSTCEVLGSIKKHSISIEWKKDEKSCQLSKIIVTECNEMMNWYLIVHNLEKDHIDVWKLKKTTLVFHIGWVILLVCNKIDSKYN